jgi:predicted TIM-barrel fold metal-dependent hydrolase
MSLDRRRFLSASCAAAAAGALGKPASSPASADQSETATRAFRRIATEEAWAIPEQMDGMRRLSNSGIDDPDFDFWRGLTGDNPFARTVGGRLLDLDDERLRIMGAGGVAMHLLLLTSTGLQMFGPETGSELATLANDRLAEAISRHPDRYAGLAAIAPQDPGRAVKEIERAITHLKLNGIVINSHTNGEYLDERKYWPILEAAAALHAPIYIHPRAPSPGMAAPYRKYRLEGAIWGYQAETGFHGLRLIASGVFDRFPNLRIVLGHMGEGLPYWLYRVDFMHANAAADQRPKLKRRPSDYFKDNFLITTSGMNWFPVLQFCLGVLGADNIMWAIDYPYQDTMEAVRFMDEAPISAADKEKIYHANAERVFRMRGV